MPKNKNSPAAWPASVSQAELADVLAKNESLNQRIIEVRNRLKRGARIEVGELSAEADKGYDVRDDGRTERLNNVGLVVMSTREFIEREARRNEEPRQNDEAAPKKRATSAAAVPVFAGDLHSARQRFQDVIATFLRCATAEDLNMQSFTISGGLAAGHGLSDLADSIRQEIEADRKALTLRAGLRICKKPADGERDVHV